MYFISTSRRISKLLWLCLLAKKFIRFSSLICCYIRHKYEIKITITTFIKHYSGNISGDITISQIFFIKTDLISIGPFQLIEFYRSYIKNVFLINIKFKFDNNIYQKCYNNFFIFLCETDMINVGPFRLIDFYQNFKTILEMFTLSCFDILCVETDLISLYTFRLIDLYRYFNFRNVSFLKVD